MNVSNASANHASISLYVVGLVNYAGPLKVQYAFVSMSADASKWSYLKYFKRRVRSMKCIDCINSEMCLDHKEEPFLIGCTSGIPERKKQTNADRIRSMSDEELAQFIEQISVDSIDTISFGTKDYEEIWEHKETALKWLQSEVEETSWEK